MGKIIHKKQVVASRAGVNMSNPSLWAISKPRKITKAEQQLFLQMHVPKSGKLGYDKSKHIKILRETRMHISGYWLQKTQLSQKLPSLLSIKLI